MIKRIVFPIALLGFLLGAFIVLEPGSKDAVVDLDVMAGETAHQVLNKLIAKGILINRYPFLFWMKIRGADTNIRLGRYQFQQGRSAFWIVDDLKKGKTKKSRVLIPEGYASWQIAQKFSEGEVCDALSFMNVVGQKAWEGFLFPATYDLDVGLPAERVAEFMKKRFDDTWRSEWDGRARELGLSKKDIVTLASIVQREGKFEDEFGMISALYHNRLKKKMRLQADPTVQYAKGKWVKKLYYIDYRSTQSPYNTYLIYGLPPGPICSPGEKALLAALWPAEADVLYMVAQEDGKHDFSTSLRDHVNKVNKRNRQKQKR